MARELAIVLMSGGLDSAVTTGIAAQNYELAALHLNYGQRTLERELKSFNDLCDHYKIDKRLIVDIKHLAQIGGSSLTDKKLAVSKANLESEETPSSYVPFRNANFLAIATSWAEVVGANKIFVGAVDEDSSGYPDCRRKFFDVFEQAIDAGTKPSTKIKIVTPIIAMKKSEIVQKGVELGVPFELTWSCYQSNDKACGVCDSCAFRLRGFQEMNVEDPIQYETRPFYQ